jgi:uncharacterized C2H2 Zn-finger protein
MLSRRCKLCKEKGRATDKVELRERTRGGEVILVCPVCDFADTASRTTVRDVQGR